MPADLFQIIRSPSRLIALATTLVALTMFLLPAPEGVPPSAMKGAALGLFAVGLYATVAIPEYLSAMTFFVIAMIFGVAPAEVVFSGFHSAAFWLMFGGLLIGVAVQNTGLGTRMAMAITSRLAGSYAALVFGIVTVGVVLSFLMPSTMGRVVLLIPVVLALCDQLGYPRETRERTGLVVAMACSVWMPSTAILPSNVPNMILAGVAERVFGLTFNYGDYMLIHMPMNGIVKALLIVVLVLVLFPARPGWKEAKISEPPPAGTGLKKLSVILAVTLALWATDFLHHISPAWIALLAGVLCLWPGYGLITSEDLKTKVNFPSAIYVAGVLSLGAVLVETGAGDWLGSWLLAHLPLSPESPFVSFCSMVGLGVLVNMASTAPSVPAIVGPLADEMARLTGIPLKTVLMSQVISYTTIVLPYQVPPLIVAMQMGGVSVRDGARMTAALALTSLVVLVPLNYLWWSWLGMFP